MMGNYPRIQIDSQTIDREIEMDQGSNRPQRILDPNSEDFSNTNIREAKTLLNTNSRENSESTVDTAQVINSEIASHICRKLEEFKDNLNVQNQDAFNVTIVEKVPPTIQSTLEIYNAGLETNLDRRYGVELNSVGKPTTINLKWVLNLMILPTWLEAVKMTQRTVNKSATDGKTVKKCN